MIFGWMRFPGTKWYVVAARSPQMVRDQKKFGKHWSRTKNKDGWGKFDLPQFDFVLSYKENICFCHIICLPIYPETISFSSV